MTKFVHMTGGQFSAGITRLGWDVERACHMLGQSRRRIMDWLHDDHDIPRWVPLFMAALTIPAAMDIVERADQHMLHDANNQMREQA